MGGLIDGDDFFDGLLDRMRTGEAEAALELIEPLGQRLSSYFHFFGVRGAFLMQLGRNDEARVAFDRAIALANTSAEAAHIRMHLDRLMRDSQPRGSKISKK